MKILHLSTNDIRGGAARAAYRLHLGLQRLGHESSMLVTTKSSQDPSVIELTRPTSFPARIRRRLRRRKIVRDFSRYCTSRPSGYEQFSDDRSQYGGEVVAQLPTCDVINLHWVADFVDYRAFFALAPSRTPVIWRLADMNALTGGCHYDHECGRFLTGCGLCPQLGSLDANDLSRTVWRRKFEVFRMCDPHKLHIVALCRWMAEQVQHSPLLGKFPVTIIPNGIDLQEFAPRDPRLARELLGIPQETCVVLFTSDDVNNRRKGLALLFEALSGLDRTSNLLLVSVGSGRPAIGDQFPSLHLGHIDYRWLSLVYSAADVFVIPSLQDNLPNTVLESMACGTPVVGFAVGGIPDMVRHEMTGLLVPPFDVRALRAAIMTVVQNPARRYEMAGHCRRVAVEEYSLDRQARRYSELYKTLV
ncbi:MAG: glycosyltransferase family 4 protein [Nitrospiraceae bacterium]